MTRLNRHILLTIFAVYLAGVTAHADDLINRVKKAVEKSTLDQEGTKPFHLKATFAPSLERDKASNREGYVEYWWQSPVKWRRELRCQEIHQILIVDGERRWEKLEGDFLPEWLHNLAQALIRPIPLPIQELTERLKYAEIRQLGWQTNLDWDADTGWGTPQANGAGHLALLRESETLLYTGGVGWSGGFKDPQSFHGRSVARTVSAGPTGIAARVTTLEDLTSQSAGFFDASQPGGDAHPIRTEYVDSAELHKHLKSVYSIEWPPAQDGPLEGGFAATFDIDRAGNVREMSAPVGDNPALKEAAAQAFRAMQFTPFVRDGVAVQAYGKLVVPFKTRRPDGVESFDSARNYFERGRKQSCLGAGAKTPYVLHAEFQTANTKKILATGRYEDTWLDAKHWRREAWFESSHLIRTQDGEQHYVQADGPDARLLMLVMHVVEPIPAEDTMTESDWQIRRDKVDSTGAIRVSSGSERSNGEPDPEHFEGHWFDEEGRLKKSYWSGLEIRPLMAETYAGVEMPRRFNLYRGGALVFQLNVKEIGPADPGASKNLRLKGHEWKRAFTAETR